MAMAPRWIDRVPVSHTEPEEMKVLCLGLSRTGTMSMWTALKTLGYSTYHFKEVGKPENLKDRHLLCWREAFYAKLYGCGKPYGASEFGKLLSRYNAVTDAPAVNFSDELIAAYPDAKVILSRRDPEKWLDSIHHSYHAVIESPTFRIATILDTPLSILGEVFELILRDWTGGNWRSREKLREGFERHNAHILATVPKDNLLEWEPKDGWGPLCQFLGKPEPDTPFPYSNKGDEVANGLLLAARIRIAKWTVRNAVWPLVTLIVARTTWSLYQHQGAVQALAKWALEAVRASE